MTAVEDALDDFQANLGRFIALLEQESQCLRDIQAEELAAVVAEKTRHVGFVNTAWNRLLAACGVSAAQTDDLDAAMGNNAILEKKWQDAKLLVQQAGHLNQTNSTLIEAQMRRTRQALDVLQQAANRGALYGSDGLMMNDFKQLHTLDKA